MVGVTSLMLVLWMAAAQAVPPGTYASGDDLEKALKDQPAAPMVVARIESTDLTRVNLFTAPCRRTPSCTPPDGRCIISSMAAGRS